jgi:hypothetical protein
MHPVFNVGGQSVVPSLFLEGPRKVPYAGYGRSLEASAGPKHRNHNFCSRPSPPRISTDTSASIDLLHALHTSYESCHSLAVCSSGRAPSDIVVAAV